MYILYINIQMAVTNFVRAYAGLPPLIGGGDLCCLGGLGGGYCSDSHSLLRYIDIYVYMDMGVAALLNFTRFSAKSLQHVCGVSRLGG